MLWVICRELKSNRLADESLRISMWRAGDMCCYEIRSQGSAGELPTAEVVGDGTVVIRHVFCLLLKFVKSGQKPDIPWTSLHARGSEMAWVYSRHCCRCCIGV